MSNISSTIDKNVDVEIKHSLEELSAGFLDSLQGDTTALKSFLHSWLSFSTMVHSCSHQINRDTLTMIYSFSETVNIVSSKFVDLHLSSEMLNEQLTQDLTRILDEGMGNLSIKAPINYQAVHNPSYEPLHRWLLTNLHMPYPSQEIRQSISSQTSFSRKDIDCWFIDARKRIGWNTLRKRSFNNKRADITDAASRFFIKKDSMRPLGLDIELAFTKIEANAKALFSKEFSESALAEKSDYTPPVDTTLKTRTKKRIQEKQRTSNSRKARQQCAADAYPTPERSPQPPSPYSVTRTLPPLSPILSCDPVSVVQVRKRCRSIESEDDPEDEYQIERPFKRQTLHEQLPPVIPSNGTCSSWSALDFDALESHKAPRILSAPGAANKRKRRLSDSDCQGFPKRARELPAGPRLHAASDPIPMPGEWIFDIPSVEELNLSADLHIDVFEWAHCNNSVSESPSQSSLFPTEPHLTDSSVSLSSSPPEDLNFWGTDFVFSEQLFNFSEHTISNEDLFLPSAEESYASLIGFMEDKPLPIEEFEGSECIARQNFEYYSLLSSQRPVPDGTQVCHTLSSPISSSPPSPPLPSVKFSTSLHNATQFQTKPYNTLADEEAVTQPLKLELVKAKIHELEVLKRQLENTM